MQARSERKPSNGEQLLDSNALASEYGDWADRWLSGLGPADALSGGHSRGKRPDLAEEPAEPAEQSPAPPEPSWAPLVEAGEPGWAAASPLPDPWLPSEAVAPATYPAVGALVGPAAGSGPARLVPPGQGRRLPRPPAPGYAAGEAAPEAQVFRARTGRRAMRRTPPLLAVAVVLAGGGYGLRTWVERRSAPPVATAPTYVGAPTPVAAVDRFVAATADGNLAAALRILAPGEAQVAGSELTAIGAELRRLGGIRAPALTTSDATAHRGAPKVAAAPTMIAPDLAEVAVDGTIAGTGGGAGPGVPAAVKPGIAQVLQAALTTFGRTPTTAKRGAAAPPRTEIAAERIDGSWYVSVGYSMALRALTSAGQPLEPPTVGSLPASGSSSASGAVQALLDDLASLDVSALVSDLAPGELGWLQTYWPQLLPSSAGSIAAVAGKVQVKFTSMQLTTTPLGYGTLVEVGDLGIDAVIDTGASGVGTITIKLQGGCDTVQIGQLSERQCGSSSMQQQGLGQLLSALPPALASSIAHIRQVGLHLGIVAVEQGGRWYVSPTATVLHSVHSLLAALRPIDAKAWVAFFDDPAALRLFSAKLARLRQSPSSLITSPQG